MFVDRMRLFSGLETNMPVEDSWTCKRVNDNGFTQWDFIIGGLQFEHDKSWHDNCLGTGLNHRCVHSLLKIRVAKRTLAKWMFGLKNWQPFIDNDGRPSNFQSRVRKLLRTSWTLTLPALEWILLTAGREHGKCRMAHFALRRSRRLRALCSLSRSAAGVGMRKKIHRQEIRLWKRLRLRQSSGRASHWKAFRNMIQTTAGQAYVSQPPLDEFVDALAATFSGNQFFPDRPAVLTETNWTLDAMRSACARLNVNKGCDESVLPSFGLNENYVLPLAENFRMTGPPARGSCRQTPCSKTVCWQWGGSRLPVLRGSFWEASWIMLSSNQLGRFHVAKWEQINDAIPAKIRHERVEEVPLPTYMCWQRMFFCIRAEQLDCHYGSSAWIYRKPSIQ